MNFLRDAKKKAEMRKRLRVFDLLPSTNEYCKSDAVMGGEIIRAVRQSAGHGRMGRSFSSEAGGLYVSFCYTPKNITPEKLVPLTGMCAVAVRNALLEACGIESDIKWTNDILFHGKKLCGILAETVFSSDGAFAPEKVIIGIGINCNQSREAFDGELSGIASSVLAETGKKVDIEALLVNLAEEADMAAEAAFSGNDVRIKAYVNEYRRHCITIGRTVRVLKNGICPGRDPRRVFAESPEVFPTAKVLDIDNVFGLAVEYENGEKETLTSGEVSVR